MSTEKKTYAERMEEYVDFETPLTADPDERDILVAVNGETLRIRRGERVQIQRKFLEVRRNAEAQRRAAVRYQRQQQFRHFDDDQPFPQRRVQPDPQLHEQEFFQLFRLDQLPQLLGLREYPQL